MNRMSQKLAKLIRVLTTAPVFAALLCVLLYALLPESFASTRHFLYALFFLTLFPLSAYPIAALLPPIRKKGRDGQRNLSVVFSVLGYIGGFLYALLGGGTSTEKVLFGTYLISGLCIGLTTLLHFKASGHACGCSGPLAMLTVFVSPWFLCAYPLLTPIFWASKKLGRHSAPQLLVGTLIPIAAMLLCRVFFLTH